MSGRAGLQAEMQLVNGLPDPIDFQTLLAGEMGRTTLRASFLVTGLTGGLGAHQSRKRARRWSGASSAGACENSNERYFQACGEVHRPRVIGEQNLRPLHQCRELLEAGLPRQVHDARILFFCLKKCRISGASTPSFKP